MDIKKFLIVSLTMVIVITSIASGENRRKRGLLIIAHGSHSAEWNKPVLKIMNEVTDLLNKNGKNPFDEVRVALMEMSEPSIASVINKFEKSEIEMVYAIPLFISPSGHSMYDVPAILGVYSDRKMTDALKSEGIEVIQTDMKIIVGPTLSYGGVLKDIMLSRVEELSLVPGEEGVVLLAHGDPDFEPIWNNLCMHIGSYVSSKTGIQHYDYAFVEVGQSFLTEGAPAILRMTKKCKKTIVVGLYLSLGTEKMAMNASLSSRMMKIESDKLFVGKNVVFSRKGLLPDKRISAWIVARAMEWIGTLR